MERLKFKDSQYLSRSWAMLKRDKGWKKPVFLLALFMIVPALVPFVAASFLCALIVEMVKIPSITMYAIMYTCIPFILLGLCLILGAGFEWARLSAWGFKSTIKQKDINLKKCLTTGLRTLVILASWHIVLHLILGPLVRAFPSLEFVSLIVNAVVSLIAQIAALYATLYDKFQLGYNITKVFTMVRHGWQGFLKILGETIKLDLIIGLIAVAFILIPLLGTGIMVGEISELRRVPGWTFTVTEYFSELKVVMHYASMLAPYSIVVVSLSIIVLTIVVLLSCNMVGLWMMQFRVSEWGDPNDPLPASLSADTVTTAETTPQIITAQDLPRKGEEQIPSSPTNPSQVSVEQLAPPIKEDNSAEKSDEHMNSVAANLTAEKTGRPEDARSDSAVFGSTAESGTVESDTAAAASDEKICIACGTKNPSDAEVCSNCGKPFNTRSRRLCSL